MRRITRKVGNSDFDPSKGPTSNEKIKRILISRPNHRLGNLLLITPLIQEIEDRFPGCEIDLFVKGGLAPIIFKNYNSINEFVQLPRKPFGDLPSYLNGWISIKKRRYDLVINVEKGSSSGRLSTQFANARFRFFGDVDDQLQHYHSDHKHVAKYPVYTFRNYIFGLAKIKRDQPVPPVDLKLSSSEITEGQRLLSKLTEPDKETISIFTYATGAKRYSEEWWENLYGKLVSEFPEYNFLEILPVENVSQIGFKTTSFYSKDIREIGAVIANTKVFIGADSGIMHLASSVQTTTIGLFSVTDKEQYKPYDNNSVAIDTDSSDADKIVETVREILQEKESVY